MAKLATTNKAQSPELISHWKLVLGCFLGLTLSIGPVVTYSFGIFAPEIMAEFGWSRAEVFRAFMAHNIGILIGAPLVGIIIDRGGARRIILYSIPIFAVLWAAIGIVVSGPIAFYVLLGLIPIAAGGALPISYSRLIVADFERQRGIALGIALAGVGVGAALLPLLSHQLIELFGWRNAYFCIAALIVIITFPNALLLLKRKEVNDVQPSPAHPLLNPQPGPQSLNETAISEQTGPEKTASEKTASQSRRGLFCQRVFWIIALFMLLTGFAITAVLVNFAPILVESGLPAATAATAASLLGVAVIIGRLCVGLLLDRFFAPYVAAAMLVAPTIAFLLLIGAPSSGLIYIVYSAALLIGLAVGAEVDIMAYLTSRYFAPAHFGFMNGLMFSMFVASGAFGPLTIGYLRDLHGNYELALQLMSAVVIAAAIAVLFSPKYEYD